MKKFEFSVFDGIVTVCYRYEINADDIVERFYTKHAANIPDLYLAIDCKDHYVDMKMHFNIDSINFIANLVAEVEEYKKEYDRLYRILFNIAKDINGGE